MSDNVNIDQGGWISGPCLDTQYNPAMVVVHVMHLLNKRGIENHCSNANSGTAVNAAADLLRALGVQPVSAPFIDHGPNA